jgi:hypothetical protein
MFLAVLWLWDTSFVYPLKLLVVFFHEISHGLAAVATGGQIDHIELEANLGGVCWSRGGWLIALLPAGYLGSMAWGAMILILASRTRYDRIVSSSLGIFLLATTLLFVRNAFGFAAGVGFGVAFLWVGNKAPEDVNELLLQFVGLTSLLYAVIDIKEDLIDRVVPISDAAQFAKHFGGPAQMWGMIWIAVALAGTAWSLRVALTRSAPGEAEATLAGLAATDPTS